jgi:hypothetical protein
MKDNEYTIIKDLQKQIKELTETVDALKKKVEFLDGIRRR